MGFKRVLNSRVAAVGAGAAALAVLAGGVGYAAGEITSHDIQDNTIRSADVKDESLKMKDFTNGAKKQMVAQQGQAGNPAAGAGYAGFPADNPHHDLWAPGTWSETVQECKDGEYVTGGGYSSFGGYNGDGSKDLGGANDVQITVSAPYIENDGAYVPISDSDSRFHADRWVVRGFNHGSEPVDVRAWVLCAPAN